jgi:hypothetical protein
VSDIGIASANVPLPKADDICEACGEFIKAVGVFTGGARAKCLCLACFGNQQPTNPEADHGRR